MVNKMSVIELQHIQKSYVDGNQMHDVIKDLSLTVEPQEFVAILGPQVQENQRFFLSQGYSYLQIAVRLLSVVKI